MLMIVVTNRLHVAPKYVQAFEERFQNRTGLVDQAPGFVQNQILRPMQEGDPYVVLTVWESQEHFEAWSNSDAFKKAHTGQTPEDMYTAPHKVEVFEIIADTSRP